MTSEDEGTWPLSNAMANATLYRLTDKGNKVALMFVLFHKRVCGPIANSLFQPHPVSPTSADTKLEAEYRRADQSIQQILQLLAA
jgi:hypothetical protein